MDENTDILRGLVLEKVLKIWNKRSTNTLLNRICAGTNMYDVFTIFCCSQQFEYNNNKETVIKYVKNII